MGRDSLVRFRPGRPRLEIACEIDSHSLVKEARTGVEMKDTPPSSGGVTRFFEQFAARRGQRGLTFVNPAGGQFPHHGLSGMSVLALEQNEGFGRAGIRAALLRLTIVPAIAR